MKRRKPVRTSVAKRHRMAVLGSVKNDRFVEEGALDRLIAERVGPACWIPALTNEIERLVDAAHLLTIFCCV